MLAGAIAGFKGLKSNKNNKKKPGAVGMDSHPDLFFFNLCVKKA